MSLRRTSLTASLIVAATMSPTIAPEKSCVNRDPKKPEPIDDRVFGAEAINRRCDGMRAAGKRPILGTPGKGYRRACLPEPPPPIPERAGSKAAQRRLKQMAKLQSKQKGGV